MGQTGSKAVPRSSLADVQDNLGWALQESSKWEDGATLVKELLATDLSEPSEALASVGRPGGTGAPIPEREQEPVATEREVAEEQLLRGRKEEGPSPRHAAQPAGEQYFDRAACRQLLYSVDEVLRQGQSQEYFKGIPQEKLEMMMSSPSSWFVLPPDQQREMSASRIFSLAAIEQAKEGKGQPESSPPTPYPTPQPAEERGAKEVWSEKEEERQGRWETEKEREIYPTTRGETTRGSIRGAESDPKEEHGVVSKLSTSSEERKLGEPSLSTRDLSTRIDLPSLERLENQRKVVVCKYLFIHRMLQNMTESAEFCVKSSSRLSHLKRLFKSGKQWEQMPAAQRFRYEQTYRDNYERLNRALRTFDRSRLTLGWLLRNYELALASHKVNATIAHLSRQQQELKQPTTSPSPLKTSIRQTQLSELTMHLHWLDRRAVQLLLELQANERDSLNMGAYFFDADLTGAVEAEEVPDISAKLFQLLDTRKRGYFTTQDLQQVGKDKEAKEGTGEGGKNCLFALCSKLDHEQQRLTSLSSQNTHLAGRLSEEHELMIEKNKVEMQRIEKEMEENKQALRGLYSYFHRSFVHHVFGESWLGAQPTHVDVDMSQLNRRLDDLLEETRVNPLEREMRRLKIPVREQPVRPAKQKGEKMGPASAKEEKGTMPKEMLLGRERTQETAIRQPETGIRSHETETGIPPQKTGIRSKEEGIRQEETGIHPQDTGISPYPREEYTERRSPQPHEEFTERRAQPREEITERQPQRTYTERAYDAEKELREEKVPEKDASALEGESPRVTFPTVREDEFGKPETGTTLEGREKPGMMQRLKEGTADWFGKKEVGPGEGEGQAYEYGEEEEMGETGVRESGHTATLGEKVKSAFGM